MSTLAMHHHVQVTYQNAEHADNNLWTDAGNGNNLCIDGHTIDGNTALAENYLSSTLV